MIFVKSNLQSANAIYWKKGHSWFCHSDELISFDPIDISLKYSSKLGRKMHINFNQHFIYLEECISLQYKFLYIPSSYFTHSFRYLTILIFIICNLLGLISCKLKNATMMKFSIPIFSIFIHNRSFLERGQGYFHDAVIRFFCALWIVIW